MSGGHAAEPPSWFEASERALDPLLNAASLLALVEGAEANGLLRALRRTTTPSEAARETGPPESRVRDSARHRSPVRWPSGWGRGSGPRRTGTR